MALRTIEIQRLHDLKDRADPLPEELRSLGLVLVFDILYDADVFTTDSSERGGTWGIHFGYQERRQANVKLHLHGYLETAERHFRSASGRSQVQHVYLISEKGRELLAQLKEAAGIE